MKYVAIWIAILAVIVASRRFSLSEVVDIIIGPVIYLNGWISDLHNLGKLYTDYQTFKNNYQQPSVIIPARTTDEQAIIAYYRMIESGKALSDKQMQRYHALLSQRATKINRLQSKLRNECVKCAAHVINQSNHFFTMAIHDLRNGNSISVDAYDSLQHAAFTHSESLSVNRVLRALISRSCLSRVLLRAMSEATTRRKLISFVVPVHKEFNRLKSPLESPLGEDFFFRKRRELSVLFAGIKNLQWELIFVDDQPINQAPTTAELLKQMIERNDSAPHQNIKVWTYDNLERYVKMFDPEFQHINRDDINGFAQQSVKGGAIYTALRKLSLSPKFQSDVIIFTDADSSTSLLQSGLILEPLFPFNNNLNTDNNGSEERAGISIGSRRAIGSVMVRDEQRNIMSLAYNGMTRLLFGLDLTDTQMGFKAVLPAVIRRTHRAFSEIGMAFDVELLWLAKTVGFQIKEIPCVWVDSDLESQSSDQGMSMFQALNAIFSRRSKQLEILGMGDRKQKIQLELPIWQREDNGAAYRNALLRRFLATDQKFNIMQLAADTKFALLVKHFNRFYTQITPQAFKDFLDSIYMLFKGLANRRVSREDLEKMIRSLEELLDTNRDYEILFRFLFVKEFPGIADVLQAVLQDHELIRLILPLLTGDNVVTSLIKMRCTAFAYFYKDFATSSNALRRPTEIAKILHAWSQTCADPKKETTDNDYVYQPADRENRARRAASFLNRALTETGNVEVHVTTFLSPGDNRDVERLIQTKLSQVQSFPEINDRIKWKFHVATSQNRPQPPKHLRMVYVRVDETATKADSTRFVFQQILNELENIPQKSNTERFVAYVDLSPKIDMSEMLVLLSKCFADDKQLPCVSIGSRRLPESRASGKPVSFLLRSSIFNWIVKMLFPNLYELTDTQTGFKLFSAKAWSLIQTTKPALESTSMAFDVEILQQASRVGLLIHESPVDFNDNTLAFGADPFSNDASDMFGDLIRIRARLSDRKLQPVQGHEARFFSAGAESIVYEISDGTLLKIPHEKADPYFAGWLKYFVFKDRKALTIDDQESTLMASQGFSSLLNHPRIKNLIPHLRQWKEFNAFVMKIVAAYEKKNYKSAAYSTAWTVGKDLIVPYRSIDFPFRVEIDGQTREFDVRSDVKQVKKSGLLFNAAFRYALQADNIEQIKGLLCSAISLTFKLWNRGLFDLDTNFMVDMGFYPVETAPRFINPIRQCTQFNGLNFYRTFGAIFEKRLGSNVAELMVIDPGELVFEKEKLDISTARKLIPGRYDFLEMQAALDGKEYAGKIVEFYISGMNAMLDLLEGEMNGQFGQDLQSANANDFLIRWHSETRSIIENPDSVGDITEDDPVERRIEAMKYAEVGYQTPYFPAASASGSGKFPFKLPPPSKFPFPSIYAVPLDLEVPADSLPAGAILTRIRLGSIEPILNVLYRNNGKLAATGGARSATLVTLDGGSASRAGILKQANQPKTKGNLLIHGRPLCHHIRDSLAPLATKLGPDYIVLSSCDDLISLDPVYFDRLAGEIHRQSLPFFWLDNDDPSKLPIYPMTTQDMLLFVEQHGLGSPQRQGEFLRIMDQVPPAKGPIESNQINDAAQIARFFGDFYQERGANNQQNGKSSQNSMAILGSVSPLISDYLRTWLSYRSMTDASGSKTPFLFIMRKDFGQKLLKIMHNHFHDFQYTDMTWESTIVRAFKSDETFWSMNKPSTVPTADWNAFYAEMQQLKVDSGILTRRDRQQERNDKKVTQMKMRLLPLNWNNFDDPYSIFTYFTRNAGDNSDSIHFTRMVSVSIDGDEQRRRIRHKLIVISDRPINKPVTVRFDQQFGEHTEGMKFRLRGKIVFVGCRNIPDTVYVKMDPTAAFWKRGAEIKVMIYRANNIQHAVVMNNHMLVGIDGQHFVTKLTPVKKDDLKQQKVWQMEQIK